MTKPRLRKSSRQERRFRRLGAAMAQAAARFLTRVLLPLLGYLVIFGIVAGVLNATGAVQPLRNFANVQQSAITTAGLAMAATGFALFMGVSLWETITRGRWTSGAELDDFYRRHPTVLSRKPGPGTVGIALAGHATRLTWSDPFTLSELWHARRDGLLWRPPWRQRLARALGLALLIAGMLAMTFAGAPDLAVEIALTALLWLALLRAIRRFDRS